MYSTLHRSTAVPCQTNETIILFNIPSDPWSFVSNPNSLPFQIEYQLYIKKNNILITITIKKINSDPDPPLKCLHILSLHKNLS